MGEGSLERLIHVLERIAQSLEGIEQALQGWSQSPNGTAYEGIKPTLSVREQKWEGQFRVLSEWLKERGLRLQNALIHTQRPKNNKWVWVAFFLGQHFTQLRDFYTAWKHAINTHKPFELFIPKEKRNDNVLLARRLQELSLIERYSHTKGKLEVVPKVEPEIIQFVTGRWLEYYMGYQLWRIAGRFSLSSQKLNVFRNIQVLLPNGRATELDVLALYENWGLWLEGKTGEYNNHNIERWQKNREYLQLPPTHAGIVLLDPPSATARQMLEQRTGMQVLALNDLPEFLERAMQGWLEVQTAPTS